MAIQHTVVFKLVHDSESAETAKFLADARTALTAIPGVRDFQINRQVSPKSGLQFQFSMVFEDDAAYTAYNEHPLHVAFVADRWVPEVAEFQEYDFIAL
jgi:hypothetical protein